MYTGFKNVHTPWLKIHKLVCKLADFYAHSKENNFGSYLATFFRRKEMSIITTMNS
jgi:hypothetical protein